MASRQFIQVFQQEHVLQATIDALTHFCRTFDKGQILVLPQKDVFSLCDITHVHHTPEFFLQIAGTAVCEFPSGKMTLTPGQVLLVPAGVPHNEYAQDPEQIFANVVFSYCEKGVWFHSARAKHKRILCHGAAATSRGQQLIDLLSEAADAHRRNPDSNNPVVSGLILAHLGLLIEILDVQSAERDTEYHIFSEKVARSMQLVNSRIRNPCLAVDWIAVQLNCAADYLSHRFHKEVGMTLSQFINKQRMTRAQSFLRFSDMSIAEISRECGFQDPAYFSRLFKRSFECTPRTFRNISINEQMEK